MISIGKYIRTRKGQLEQSLRHIIQLLLQGIQHHVVEGDSLDYEQFRSGLQVLADKISEQTPPAELLVISGATLKGLKDYSERTTRFVRAQGLELQRMISMLTQTVMSIGSTSELASSRLQEIEKQLERASMIEDVRIVRLKLSQCLESIREEADRQRQEASNTIASLNQEIQESGGRAATAFLQPDIDPVTGLPNIPSALAVFKEAAQSRGPFFVATLVADRVQLINSRFGYAVGDEMLRAICAEIRKGLSAQDRLFRWRGPSILALLERSESLERVRMELSRIASFKLEKMVDIGTRSVLLPVSACWTVFPMMAPVSLLATKIDEFVAAQLPPE